MYKRIERFVSFTQRPHECLVQTPNPLTQGATAAASCTTSSVYVNLSKNSFLSASRGVPKRRFSFSGCKGTAFFRTTKTFSDFFFKKRKKSSNLDRNQPQKAVFGLKVWLLSLLCLPLQCKTRHAHETTNDHLVFFSPVPLLHSCPRCCGSAFQW